MGQPHHAHATKPAAMAAGASAKLLDPSLKPQLPPPLFGKAEFPFKLDELTEPVLEAQFDDALRSVGEVMSQVRETIASSGFDFNATGISKWQEEQYKAGRNYGLPGFVQMTLAINRAAALYDEGLRRGLNLYKDPSRNPDTSQALIASLTGESQRNESRPTGADDWDSIRTLFPR